MKPNPFGMQNPAGNKMPAKVAAAPIAEEKKPATDGGVTVTYSKTPEGIKCVVDDGDELGPQESVHPDMQSAKEAVEEVLEKKFGGDSPEVEKAEGEAAPMEKAGSYLSKLGK